MKITLERSLEMFKLAGIDRDAFLRAILRMGAKQLKTAQMRKEYDAENPTRNYCYVITEWLKYCVFGKDDKRVKAFKLEVEGYDTFHNFLTLDGEIVDLSAEQFPDYSKVVYANGKPTTYMMAPSKRATLLHHYYTDELAIAEYFPHLAGKETLVATMSFDNHEDIRHETSLDLEKVDEVTTKRAEAVRPVVEKALSEMVSKIEDDAGAKHKVNIEIVVAKRRESSEALDLSFEPFDLSKLDAQGNPNFDQVREMIEENRKNIVIVGSDAGIGRDAAALIIQNHEGVVVEVLSPLVAQPSALEEMREALTKIEDDIAKSLLVNKELLFRPEEKPGTEAAKDRAEKFARCLTGFLVKKNFPDIEIPKLATTLISTPRRAGKASEAKALKNLTDEFLIPVATLEDKTLKYPITLQQIAPKLWVLRDEFLPGGTKSTYVHDILDRNPAAGYLFSTPPEGGYQIALATACKERGKRCVIVTAHRKEKHAHTLTVKELGGRVFEVKTNAFQSRLEKVGREIAQSDGLFKIEFGANYDFGIETISQRMKAITAKLGREPEEIFCAVGSGTLLKGILRGTEKAKIFAVMVGKNHTLDEFDHQNRVELIRHRLPFQKPLAIKTSFQPNATYEAKAFEVCRQRRNKEKLTLFWNVYK